MTPSTARRLLEQTGRHPVISLYLDLDPEEFATAPARTTQFTSLLDETDRAVRDDQGLDHDERKALRDDLERLRTYLASDDLPVSGARALAVFASARDDLFETLQLTWPAGPKAVLARTAYVEPLVADDDHARWCVTLISRRAGEIFLGPAAQLDEAETVKDDVPGRSHGKGLAQANYQRSVDDDADHHMRRVAEEVFRHWQSRPFARLVVGGTEPDVDRFVQLLHSELRPLLAPGRLPLEPETSRPAEVRAAAAQLLAGERSAQAETKLAQLEERVAADGAAVVGIEPTLAALAERRVEQLVMDHNFAASGKRCPSDGFLYPDRFERCPVDETVLRPVPDLREAAVEAAVLQDAGVTVVGEGSDPPAPVLQRGEGIAALLRF